MEADSDRSERCSAAAHLWILKTASRNGEDADCLHFLQVLCWLETRLKRPLPDPVMTSPDQCPRGRS